MPDNDRTRRGKAGIFLIDKEEKIMRIVVKLGTSTLTHPTGRLHIRRVEKLVKVLSDIKNAGHDLILVSSGAIGMGVGKLNLKGRPEDMATKQAAAAVGQCELMYMYDKLFRDNNHIVAQILMTGKDFDDPVNVENFTATMNCLTDLGAIPVINENDVIATEEIALGDNDSLGAIVACRTGADLLIILSDIDGLYTKDPRDDPEAEKLDVVAEITEDIKKLAGNKGTSLSVGGMVTKIGAAETVTAQGIDMVIANGKNPDILYDILEGKKAGTRFLGKK